jgi:hypothetical protein
VQVDPVEEQRKAEAEAQVKANSEMAQRRRRRARSSLLTSGATGSGIDAPSLLSQAKPGG